MLLSKHIASPYLTITMSITWDKTYNGDNRQFSEHLRVQHITPLYHTRLPIICFSHVTQYKRCDSSLHPTSLWTHPRLGFWEFHPNICKWLSGKRKGWHSIQLPGGSFTERWKAAFGSVSGVALQQFKLINKRLEIVSASSPQIGMLLSNAI